MYDLHCHSHFSDGALSPDALLKTAIDAGVGVLALTDHDTVSGLSLLHEAARFSDVAIINGIELSTRWKKHDIHIVGLNIKPDHPDLCSIIEQQNARRVARAKAISLCLAEVGVQDSYQKASEIAGHDRVGRPHFAAVLVKEGVAIDATSAFKRFLGRGRCAYVQTEWIDIPEAVSAIVTAGGQAVLAHPLKYKLTRSKLHALIELFKNSGGVGIEVVSGEMTISQITEMAGVSVRFGLLASTGSDYHHHHSRIRLGRQLQLPVNCTPIWHQWDRAVRNN